MRTLTVNRIRPRCLLQIGALALGVIFAPAHLAFALSPVVVNPGFEDISGESMPNEFTFGPFPGWDLYDGSGAVNTTGNDQYFIGTLTPQPDLSTPDPNDFINFPNGAFEGERVAIAFNFEGNDVGNGGTEYGLEQTLDDALIDNTLQANTRYDLSVAIGNIDSGQSVANGFFQLSGFPGYRIELLAGGETLVSDSTSAGVIADGDFGIATLSFTTGATHSRLGEALGIRLVNLNVVDLSDPSFANSDLEVDFDDVQLTAVVVPIPGMLPVIALLLTGLASRARRV